MVAAYIDAVSAQSYFDSKLNTDAWDNAVASEREKALKNATLLINKLQFSGNKTDPLQVNEFPRDGELSAPDNVKWATCELALALLDGVDPNEEYKALAVTADGFSSARTSYDRRIILPHIAAGIPSIEAWQYLLPYLKKSLEVKINRVS